MHKFRLPAPMRLWVAGTCVALVVTGWFVHDDLGRVLDAHPSPRAGAGTAAKESTAPSPTAAVSPSHKTKVQQKAKARASALAKLARQAESRSKALRQTPPVSTFRFMTQNALADSIVGGAGRRTSEMIAMMRREGVDIAVFQEFQIPQQQTFMSNAGEYDIYPRGTDKMMPRAVVWRRDRFELVDSTFITTPWFYGTQFRHTPRVLLRDKKTGAEFYVATYHNPPNSKGIQDRWRHQAMNIGIADTNSIIAQTGRPIIVAGDMNDRGVAYCGWTSGAPMAANLPGSTGGACRPPSRMPYVDWVFASDKNVSFLTSRFDSTSLREHYSDHPSVVVDLRVTGLASDRDRAR